MSFTKEELYIINSGVNGKIELMEEEGQDASNLRDILGRVRADAVTPADAAILRDLLAAGRWASGDEPGHEGLMAKLRAI